MKKVLYFFLYLLDVLFAFFGLIFVLAAMPDITEYLAVLVAGALSLLISALMTLQLRHYLHRTIAINQIITPIPVPPADAISSAPPAPAPQPVAVVPSQNISPGNPAAVCTPCTRVPAAAGTARDKGKSLSKALTDYVVIDLETTGTNCNTCSVVELSALRVRDNLAEEEFSTLINPGRHIPAGATAVNGITDAMVAGAPDMATVLPDFLRFVDDDIVVGHNINTYDLNILYDYCSQLQIAPFKNDFVDTLTLAKKYVKDADNYKLTTLADYFGVNYSRAHRAMADCYINHFVYEAIKALIPAKPEKKPRYPEYSIYNEPEEDIEDLDFDISIDLSGKKFCLSGEFAAGSRLSMERRLTSLGGIPMKSVTKNTAYLLMGGEGSNHYNAGTRGSKHKKALELQTDGIGIQIIEENELILQVIK